MFFQHATSDRFIGTVEQIIDRKARGFVSGMDVENDIAAERFHVERDAQPREPDCLGDSAFEPS